MRPTTKKIAVLGLCDSRLQSAAGRYAPSMKYSLCEYEIRRTGGRNHCFAVDEFLCCAKDEIPALRTGANLKGYCPSNSRLRVTAGAVLATSRQAPRLWRGSINARSARLTTILRNS